MNVRDSAQWIDGTGERWTYLRSRARAHAEMALQQGVQASQKSSKYGVVDMMSEHEM